MASLRNSGGPWHLCKDGKLTPPLSRAVEVLVLIIPVYVTITPTNLGPETEVFCVRYCTNRIQMQSLPQRSPGLGYIQQEVEGYIQVGKGAWNSASTTVLMWTS